MVPGSLPDEEGAEAPIADDNPTGTARGSARIGKLRGAVRGPAESQQHQHHQQNTNKKKEQTEEPIPMRKKQGELASSGSF